MSESEENNENRKKTRKKRRNRTKPKLEEEEEQGEGEEEIKPKKKTKKRSKTTKKDRETNDENDNLEDNEERPKRRRKRSRKKEEDEEEIKNSENEDNEMEGKSKKKKRRKKKKNDNDNENENNEENENEESPKPKRRKRRRKKKDEENDNEGENNEDEEEGNSKKKKKKKNKFIVLEPEILLSSKETKEAFYKTAQRIIKKKKKKEKNNEAEDEDNDEDVDNGKEVRTMKKSKSTLSNKLRGAPNKKKTLLKDKIVDKKKDEETEKNMSDDDNDDDDDDNDDNENIDTYDEMDDNWKSVKKSFLELIEAYFNEIRLYEHIDIAIVSYISLTKKEYGKCKLTKHHEVYPIKNFNNINWAKEPYHKIQEKFYKLIAPGELLAKNHNYDFSNRVCNLYEIYTANIQLIVAKGNDITQKMKLSDFHFLPKDKNIILFPHLLLFFSFTDEKSLIFYREVLEYLKENKDKFIFMPIYAPLVQVEKNCYYVTEMLYRHKIYKKGDEFDIYFASNDALSKRFKYISEDNKKTITCKVVFLDVINNSLVIRSITDLDSFTFNLIEYNNNKINISQHKKFVKNIAKLKNPKKKLIKSLSPSLNCNLILKKAKIYTISNSDKKLKLKYTLYDSLTGKIKSHNIYKLNEEKYQKLCDFLNNTGNYKLRSNPKNYTLDYRQKSDLIIEEMNKCIQKNNVLENVTYKGIFQTQKVIMSLGQGFNSEQKFEPTKTKSFKLEVHINYKLFDELNPMNIIGSLYGLTQFSCFNNCDYIACLPKIGETFPEKLTLTDRKTLEETQLYLNSDKPSLIVIFSLAFQNYFASSELNSRFKLITKKLNKFYEDKEINIILIYRGEPSKFKLRYEQIQENNIFNLDFPLYIQSSANMKFPLIFRNNDIESTDSQIMTYILNKNNKLVYSGNLEEIEIDKTFDNLCNDQDGDIENKLVYKENAHLKYEDFKQMIKPTMIKIEQIIEKELKQNKSLLYRPFFSLSYNSYINFENEKTDYKKYVNHIRLRILVKEKHSNITQNIEFKNIINELKKYGASTIVMNIPCEEEFNFDSQCSSCQKSIKKISQDNPIYFDEESKKTFCESCGEHFSNDIKNDTFVTFFNTNNYNDEVIFDMYDMYNKRDVSINPILGNICKLCQNKIGSCYYLNLTNFNIEYIESPLTPIDICDVCFNEMRNGEPFLGDPLKRLNYEKLGLNYRQMIYRKIYIPLTGE